MLKTGIDALSSGQFNFPLPVQLALPDELLIAGHDRPFLVTSRRMIPTLLFLPVSLVQMRDGLTLPCIQSLVADPDVQPVPLIGPVLNRCPSLALDGNILSLVPFSVLLRKESLRPHGTGRHDEMYMRVIFRRVCLVSYNVDRRDCTQAIRYLMACVAGTSALFSSPRNVTVESVSKVLSDP